MDVPMLSMGLFGGGWRGLVDFDVLSWGSGARLFIDHDSDLRPLFLSFAFSFSYTFSQQPSHLFCFE